MLPYLNGWDAVAHGALIAFGFDPDLLGALFIPDHVTSRTCA